MSLTRMIEVIDSVKAVKKPMISGEVVGRSSAASSVSRKVRSFVEGKIRDWLRWQRIDAERSRFKYEVVLQREGESPHFACQIQLQGPSVQWTGLGVAPGLHQAVLKSLQHMIRTPPRIEVWREALANSHSRRA